MGLSNKLFDNPFNCTDAQLSCQNAVSGNSENYDGHEVSNDQLDLVVFYSSQLGVPVRRNAKDINVVKGKEIFLKLVAILVILRDLLQKMKVRIKI